MAQRPEDLVELLPAAEPFLSRGSAADGPVDRRGPVLMHDLSGDFDAAHAARLAGAHLLDGLSHEVIARFDADSLPRPPAADDLQRRPIRVVRRAGD